MRKILLMAALVGLMSVPVAAQRPRFDPNVMTAMGLIFQNNDDGLLLLKSVQTELKLTDKQKEALTADLKKVRDKYAEKIKEAREDMDFDKMRELGQKQTKELTPIISKFRAGLKTEQNKRFMQIRLQRAVKAKNPAILGDKDVQGILKLTKKQQTKIKESLSELEKDVKELRDDAKGDRTKMRAMREKIQKAQAETYATLAKSLTKDQSKALTDTGDKFEVKELNFGGFGRKEKGKKAKGRGKDKKKKNDDF